jgi:uncharacterized protein YbdZ (MbtH family)
MQGEDDEALPDDWVVLLNDDEQYSLWPALNKVPAGWRLVGTRGSKPQALAYIELHWTDMRPKSSRPSNDRRPPETLADQ